MRDLLPASTLPANVVDREVLQRFLRLQIRAIAVEFLHVLRLFFNPAIIGIAALFLSILWMLRNDRDRTRPLLVIALVINLFYRWLLSTLMGRENSLVPLKYDYVLLNLD